MINHKTMNFLNRRSKEIRKEIGLTQEEYAKCFGVRRCTIGAYEEGRACIPISFIPKIMELGNIPKEKMYDFIFNENFKMEDQ